MIRHQGTGNSTRSGELVVRDAAEGWRSGGEQGFNPGHGFGSTQNVATNVADLGGNVIDHDQLAPPPDGVDDCPCFIRAGASHNRTFQGCFSFPEAFATSRAGLRTP